MKSIILVVDAGSSSVRCMAYEYHSVVAYRHKNLAEPWPQIISLDPSDRMDLDGPLVTAVEGISHSVQLQAIVPSTGHIRIHDVLAAMDTCVDEVLQMLRRRVPEHDSSSRYRIVGVGFSSFVMNLAAVDINGEPVGEVATCSYACNRKDVVEECEKLRKILGPAALEAMYQRTGAPLHASYALPQLRAFYANKDNQALAKTIDQWKTIASICIHRWTGKPRVQMPITYSEASWTGMLDFRTGYWDDEVVELVESCEGICMWTMSYEEGEEVYDEGIDILPPILDFDSPLPFLRGGIPEFTEDRSTNIYWERWPELRAITVSLFFGLGDGAAANIGSKCGYSKGPPAPASGASRAQRVAVTIGTSAAMRVCLPLGLLDEDEMASDNMQIPQGLFCYRVHRDMILVGGALTDGGSIVEWARSLLNLQSPEQLGACLARAEQMYEDCFSQSKSPATTNVTMIPFLNGERSTHFRGGASACISGLTRESAPADVMRACLESVILRLGCVLHLILQVSSLQLVNGDKPASTVLVASGNALERNALWRKMLADCSSMDVVIDDETSEGTCRGVAMLIATVLRQEGYGLKMNKIEAIDEPLKRTVVTRPRDAATTYWKNAIVAQESLIDAISPTWKHV